MVSCKFREIVKKTFFTGLLQSPTLDDHFIEPQYKGSHQQVFLRTSILDILRNSLMKFQWQDQFLITLSTGGVQLF